MSYIRLTYLSRKNCPKSRAGTFESKIYSEPSQTSKELTVVIFAKKLHFRCLVGSECDFEIDICIVNFPPILHFDKVGLSLILSMFLYVDFIGYSNPNRNE